MDARNKLFKKSLGKNGSLLTAEKREEIRKVFRRWFQTTPMVRSSGCFPNNKESENKLIDLAEQAVRAEETERCYQAVHEAVGKEIDADNIHPDVADFILARFRGIINKGETIPQKSQGVAKGEALRADTAKEMIKEIKKWKFLDFEGDNIVGEDARFTDQIKALKAKFAGAQEAKE
jgi:hypothetical protein